jgi:tellurite resistance protein
MSSQESEQMLALLKELSLLKVLDMEYAASPRTDSERDAHRQRQQRHQEIAEEIKALGAQKQEAEENPATPNASHNP